MTCKTPSKMISAKYAHTDQVQSGKKRKAKAKKEKMMKTEMVVDKRQVKETVKAKLKNRSTQARTAPLKLHSPARAANKRTRTDVRPTQFRALDDGERFAGPRHPQFDKLLATSYTGFVLEPRARLPTTFHSAFERAFAQLDDEGFFLYDIVAPGGFSASTYVRRTLVGDPGITYKYLGLRLFAHPWSDGDGGVGDGDADIGVKGSAGAESGQTVGVRPVFREVGRLNKELQRRTEGMVQRQVVNRLPNGEQPGSCAYNLTLINRMDPRHMKPDLKPEPLFGMGKCSVSWHCDSGLENFSSIAVYQTMLPSQDAHSKGEWGIALRVGSAAHRDDVTPAINVPMASGDTYYMLDDFNHHHQHAVIAGDSLRYSSTHRVSRFDDAAANESNTLGGIIRRCNTVRARAGADRLLKLEQGSVKTKTQGSGQSHEQTVLCINSKQVRAEQNLLSELEFEWVRQFWVQGQHHADKHAWWLRPIARLTAEWRSLEQRTLATIRTLKHAASDPALATECGVSAKAFDTMMQALADREQKRTAWKKRVAQKAYRKLPKEQQPVEPPNLMDSTPLSGPLNDLVKSLAQWRAAFVQQRVSSSNNSVLEPQTTSSKKRKQKPQKQGTKNVAKAPAPGTIGGSGMSNWALMQASMNKKRRK